MRFDATINLGHVCIIVGFLSSGITAYYGLKGTLENHEWRLAQTEAVQREQNTVNRTTNESLGVISRDLAVIRTRTESGLHNSKADAK